MKAILAVNQNNIIGANNDLLWWIPEDMIWFKEKTLGKTVVMGKNTFESLGMPNGLPHRSNYVLTSDTNFKSGSVKTVKDWNEILWLNARMDLVVIGGATLYNFGLEKDLFTTIYVTQVLQRQPASEGVDLDWTVYEWCNSGDENSKWDVEIDSRGWQQSVHGEVFRFVTLRKKVIND
jgi:dihydrofolate reductase